MTDVNLEPGKYIATVSNYSIGKGETGHPFISVMFKLKDHNKNQFWRQALTVNTQSFVAKNLVELALLRTKKFSDIAKGVEGGALATDVEVELVLAYDDTGKYLNVQYVNRIGGGAMKGALAAADAVSVLAGLNLDAEILAAEQETGMTIPTDGPAQAIADSDVPF